MEIDKLREAFKKELLNSEGKIKVVFLKDKNKIVNWFISKLSDKKWTNEDVHFFLNDYVNQLSIKNIKINKPICSNTICESINEFLQFKRK